jgi:hypothetical protein
MLHVTSSPSWLEGSTETTFVLTAGADVEPAGVLVAPCELVVQPAHAQTATTTSTTLQVCTIWDGSSRRLRSEGV